MMHTERTAPFSGKKHAMAGLPHTVYTGMTMAATVSGLTRTVSRGFVLSATC